MAMPVPVDSRDASLSFDASHGAQLQSLFRF
jgi:hypothetical protein